jgi:hypothetical protein
LIRSQAAAIERHLGAEAAGTIKAVCGLPDAQEIEQLFRNAGFAEVAVEPVTLTLTHPDGRSFISGMLASTPLAGALAEMPAQKLNAIIDDVLDEFGPYFDGQKLEFPHISNVVTARA